MSGLEVQAQLQLVSSHTNVIVLTARETPAIRDRCAGRRRVWLSRKTVRRRGVSLCRPSSTSLCGVSDSYSACAGFLCATDFSATGGIPCWSVGIIFLRGDAKGIRLLGVSMDVTAQKLAQDALRESEARFRNVANTAPMMIWMSGTDKLCTFFNKGWLDFTGRPLE